MAHAPAAADARRDRAFTSDLSPWPLFGGIASAGVDPRIEVDQLLLFARF